MVLHFKKLTQTLDSNPDRRETYTNAVIPDGDSMLFPAESNVKLLRCNDNVIEVPQDSIALHFRYADNLAYEPGVHE